jgi:hypothetical protein
MPSLFPLASPKEFAGGSVCFPQLLEKSVFPFRNHNFTFFQQFSNLIHVFCLKELHAREAQSSQKKHSYTTWTERYVQKLIKIKS